MRSTSFVAFAFVLVVSMSGLHSAPSPPNPNPKSAPNDLPLGLNLDRLLGQLTQYLGCLAKSADPNRGLPDAEDLVTCTNHLVKNLLSETVLADSPPTAPPKKIVHRPHKVRPAKVPNVKQVIKIVDRPANPPPPQASAEAQASVDIDSQ